MQMWLNFKNDFDHVYHHIFHMKCHNTRQKHIVAICWIIIFFLEVGVLNRLTNRPAGEVTCHSAGQR